MCFTSVTDAESFEKGNKTGTSLEQHWISEWDNYFLQMLSLVVYIPLFWFHTSVFTFIVYML